MYLSPDDQASPVRNSAFLCTMFYGVRSCRSLPTVAQMLRDELSRPTPQQALQTPGLPSEFPPQMSGASTSSFFLRSVRRSFRDSVIPPRLWADLLSECLNLSHPCGLTAFNILGLLYSMHVPHSNPLEENACARAFDFGCFNVENVELLTVGLRGIHSLMEDDPTSNVLKMFETLCNALDCKRGSELLVQPRVWILHRHPP